MAINNWISKIKSQEKQQKETFFALEIEQETVKSAVWSVENKQTQVLKVGTIEDRKERDEESFLKAVDVTISSAGEGVIPEPKGILFGLPEDWVEKNSIVPKRKPWLKKLCDKLELKPLGFVVTSEAIIQYFKAQQGTPLHSLLIKIGETDLLVSLVLTGKMKASEAVGKTEDLVADVKEGLARFSVENLPPRMILYDGMLDFEEAKQQLMSFDWQKELPFLHFPKIEALSRDVSIRAVAIAGGSEVARSLGLEVAESPEGEKEETEAEPEAKVSPEPSVEKEEKSEIAAGAEAADFGFVKGKDILEKKPEPLKEETFPAQPIKVKDGALPEEPSSSTDLPGLVSRFKGKALGIIRLFKELMARGGRPSVLRGYKGIAIMVVIVLTVLTIGGFAFYWYVPKAEVVIYVTPKILEKELTIQVSTEADSIDIDKAIIPGKEREIETDGSLSASTTGRKLVGDKAKGKVTILNKTDGKKTFDKGTILVGPDSLRFELADEVTVASRSAEQVADGEKITYGKVEVEATAADIGPEYNLDKGTELSFKSYTSSKYSAKTDEGFSGGTSRDIQAVSEEDQQSLLTKLTDQLKSESRETLEAGSDNQEVFEEGIVVQVLEENFDKEIGDEAENLNLNLKLKLSALSFSKNDLNGLLMNSLSESLPDDFQLKTEDIETVVDEVEIEKGEATIKLVAKAKLLPKYDVVELRDNLTGKYPSLVLDYLKTLPNFAKADISISPRLPGKLSTLPRVKEKIKIKLEIMD